ncbi:MAG: DUF4331 domain-containing protein [Akkermansiaceae bacterium]|nr:DUF4331 domain-containing protein [Akkermansiaceae bacterium]
MSALTCGMTLTLLTALPASASSHSDAPLIKQDPQANLTDVYAFVGKKYDSDEDVLNVIVSVRPFSDPGDGLIYERFADDALYSIHVTHPETGREQLRYDFWFTDVNPRHGSGLKNRDTILSYGRGTEVGPIEEVGDARQNYTQRYWVLRNNRFAGHGTVPPPNVGVRTTPHYNDSTTGLAVSGATQLSELDSYTRDTITTLKRGEAAWAGSREDGFYADTPGIFDLLDARILDNNGDLGDGLGQDGGGVDGFKGFNVLSFGVQIPLDQLSPAPYTAAFADLGNQGSNPLPSVAENTGVGVYASVSRRRITLRSDRREAFNFGSWVQVNRLANPLFNEVLVALKDKDKYNRTSPPNDAANFGQYAENPEVATLVNVVFGTSFESTGRGDLALVYLPDVIRVDTTTGPVSLPGDGSFSRFGFAGGDVVTNGAGRVISSGWPNGRRIGDDVIDIALTAVASGPGYDPVTVVGDNVDANDQLYNRVFPYLGTPHAGSAVDQRQAP